MCGLTATSGETTPGRLKMIQWKDTALGVILVPRSATTSRLPKAAGGWTGKKREGKWDERGEGGEISVPFLAQTSFGDFAAL